jgi:hypothetical protein
VHKHAQHAQLPAPKYWWQSDEVKKLTRPASYSGPSMTPGATGLFSGYSYSELSLMSQKKSRTWVLDPKERGGSQCQSEHCLTAGRSSVGYNRSVVVADFFYNARGCLYGEVVLGFGRWKLTSASACLKRLAVGSKERQLQGWASGAG